MNPKKFFIYRGKPGVVEKYDTLTGMAQGPGRKAGEKLRVTAPDAITLERAPAVIERQEATDVEEIQGEDCWILRVWGGDSEIYSNEPTRASTTQTPRDLSKCVPGANTPAPKGTGETPAAGGKAEK